MGYRALKLAEKSSLGSAGTERITPPAIKIRKHGLDKTGLAPKQHRRAR